MLRPVLPILCTMALALPAGAAPPAARPAPTPAVIAANGGMVLPDGVWAVTEIAGEVVSADAGVTLQFVDDRVAGRSGCNRYGAAVTVAGGRVTFGTPMVTRMACPAEAMAVERAFLAALAATTGFAVTPGALTLFSGDMPLFRAVPAPDQ